MYELGPEFIDVNHSQPRDYLSTLVIVFKERENTFGSSRKVKSAIKEAQEIYIRDVIGDILIPIPVSKVLGCGNIPVSCYIP